CNSAFRHEVIGECIAGCKSQCHEFDMKCGVAVTPSRVAGEEDEAADDRDGEPTHHPGHELPVDSRNRLTLKAEAEQTQVKPDQSSHGKRHTENVSCGENRESPCGLAHLYGDPCHLNPLTKPQDGH